MSRSTSSSSTTPTRSWAASAMWPATTAAWASSASQSATRVARWALRTRSVIRAGVRRLSWTKVASVLANWSFRSGMTAVWGIGRPRGWRNRAVTANQSASPPTSDASAPARTKPRRPRLSPARTAATNTADISPSRPVARRLVTRSSRARTGSTPNAASGERGMDMLDLAIFAKWTFAPNTHISPRLPADQGFLRIAGPRLLTKGLIRHDRKDPAEIG